jgi:hypothetical protein
LPRAGFAAVHLSASTQTAGVQILVAHRHVHVTLLCIPRHALRCSTWNVTCTWHAQHDTLCVLVSPYIGEPRYTSSQSCVLSCLLQVFVGSFRTKEEASRAHDWATIAISGTDHQLNVGGLLPFCTCSCNHHDAGNCPCVTVLHLSAQSSLQQWQRMSCTCVCTGVCRQCLHARCPAAASRLRVHPGKDTAAGCLETGGCQPPAFKLAQIQWVSATCSPCPCHSQWSAPLPFTAGHQLPWVAWQRVHPGLPVLHVFLPMHALCCQGAHACCCCPAGTSPSTQASTRTKPWMVPGRRAGRRQAANTR